MVFLYLWEVYRTESIRGWLAGVAGRPFLCCALRKIYTFNIPFITAQYLGRIWMYPDDYMSKNILIYPHLRHIHHRHRIFSSNVKAIIIHPHAANPTEKTRQRTARAQRARGGVEGVRPSRPGSHRQTLWEIIPLWLSLYFYASGGRWINVGRKQEEEHGESACSMSPGQRER